MSVYSIYFSPTGGTEKVMEILEEALSAEKSFELTKEDFVCNQFILKENDLCIVGVPSFGGRVPDIALERIRQIKGNHAKAVMVVVYGNRAYDDTILELKNELISSGFQVTGAVAAVAEHSIMHQFGAGRPDAQDKQELQQFAVEIKKQLPMEKKQKELQVPGNIPYREYGGVPFKPQPDKKCDQCGLCAGQCPVQAISKDDLMKADTEKCISCMRCVAICPKKARKLNKVLLFAASQKMKKACGGRKKNELFL